MFEGVETLKEISNLEEPLTLSPVFLWGSFVITLVVFAVFSIMLFYHWRKYDWENGDVKKAGAIYIAGAIVLFITTFFIIVALD